MHNKIAEGLSLKYSIEFVSTVRMNLFPKKTLLRLILHCLEQHRLHYSLNGYDILILRFSYFVWILYESGPMRVAGRSEE
jgi:hypothetical protein